jgi:hypothetical protein
MEGPRNTSLFPILSYARVIGYDPVNHGVYVDIPSQQAISIPARILIDGPADASRIEQHPLPIIGTWGLVAIPFGSSSSVIWLGSFYMSSVNAITTSNPPTLEDGQIYYMSHASGVYEILDYNGNYCYRSSDGTLILINQNDQEPLIYRNIVDSETGQQKLIQYNDADRNSNPPSPFYAAIQHPTGTSETITPSGIISKKTGPGGQDTPTAGPVLELNPLSSNVNAPQGTPAGGAQLIGQAGNSDIYLDKDGNIQIISNGNNTVVQVNATGDINIISGTNINETSTDEIDITAGTDLSITASNVLTITVGGNVIGILSDGAITITSSSGSTIFLGPGGEIHLISPTAISMQAPAGTITANGNVLG